MYNGNLYEKGELYELEEVDAAALGDETVVEASKKDSTEKPVKSFKKAVNKQQKPADTK